MKLILSRNPENGRRDLGRDDCFDIKKEGRPPAGTHSELRLSGAVVPLPMRGISSYMPTFIRTMPAIIIMVPNIL